MSRNPGLALDFDADKWNRMGLQIMFLKQTLETQFSKNSSTN